MLPGILLSAAAGIAAADLAGTTLEVHDAPDADQGVAVDSAYFFAVDNYVIAKYARETGELVGRWDGGAEGPIRHLNSCIRIGRLLECANSNYPVTPMASSVEVFDAETLQHVDSHSLGLTDEGSLTWTDVLDGGRIAGFAHYGKKGGEPHKNNAYGAVVSYDERWRRTGGWAFPPALAERMAPYAASGGAIGPDGLLYVMGHDRPEMYVLGKPARGPYLVHIATITLEAEGQAFSFEPGGRPIVWVVDRRAGKVRRIVLPETEAPASARRFR